MIEPRWRRPDIAKTERNAALVAFYLAPHTARQTAAEFGISEDRVKQILRDSGTPRRSCGWRMAPS